MKAFWTVALTLVGLWVSIVLYSGRNEPDFAASVVGIVVLLTPWLMGAWGATLFLRWVGRTFGRTCSKCQGVK